MIDLHCHLLPGLDDGPATLEDALEMARIAVADGITHTVCTPHIYPGLYPNNADVIAAAVTRFRQALAAQDIALAVSDGADIHLTPECLSALSSGHYPTLAASRYFLLEPPHHAVPARFLAQIHDALHAGFVPLITHPERLDWLDETHYPWFCQAARAGAWLQVTAGALLGRFGRHAQRWSERFATAGLIHVLASDAHDPRRRRPELSAARQRAAQLLGAEEATRLVVDRPAAILAHRPPHAVPAPPGLAWPNPAVSRPGGFRRWLQRWRDRRPVPTRAAPGGGGMGSGR